jgi:DNA-binding IclR family transcriptional regulator
MVATAQTFDRGLDVLETIALRASPPTIDEVASELALHRSIVYRLVRTLELRRLVFRDGSGRLHPGARLAVLARGVSVTVRSAALAELPQLANTLGMTAFLVVRDADEAVTIESVEPTGTGAHVAYRPGTRHPVDRGAPGLALLAAEPPRSGERAEVATARRRGWVRTTSEVLPGMAALAAPVQRGAAIAVLWPSGMAVDQRSIARAVSAAAGAIAARLGTPSPG